MEGSLLESRQHDQCALCKGGVTRLAIDLVLHFQLFFTSWVGIAAKTFVTGGPAEIVTGRSMARFCSKAVTYFLPN
jgi:hypothetical protein